MNQQQMTDLMTKKPLNNQYKMLRKILTIPLNAQSIRLETLDQLHN